MNVKDINETYECFWDKNADGEDVLRLRGSVWFTFEAERPGKIDGVLDFPKKRKKRKK